ncbi:MAG: hypothetical protein ACRCU2_06290 [Planktothrix sp.]
MPKVPKVHQFKPENKCPDCVFMKLELEPVETPTLNPLKKEVKSLQLFLTLNFSWQEEKISGGIIRFGIDRGTLSLNLSNCSSLYQFRNFVKKLEEEILIEKQNKYSDNQKNSLNSSISATEVKSQIGLDSQRHREEINKLKTTVCQVSGKGAENNPSWNFEVKDGSPYLIGGIFKEVLARLEIDSNPCVIEAVFTTSIKNLYIEGVDGIWPTKISRNKKAIIEKFLVRRLLEPKTQPYVSKQDLKHG